MTTRGQQPKIHALLPIELLAEIFLDGIIGMDEQCRKDFSSSWSRILSQVCQLWREVSLSIPALWRTIPALTVSDDRAHPCLELLKLFLERSQPAPDIDIVVAGSLSRPHPALDLLLNHSHRWGNAKFDVPIFKPDLLTGLKGRLFQLNMLQLQYNVVENTMSNPCDLFTLAPNLQFVDLISKDTVHWILLPYQQIRSLSISSPNVNTIDHFFNHLNKSIFLQRLCLNTRLHSPTFNFTGSIDLPGLTQLQLEIYHQDDQLVVLRSIRVPVLERLVVVGYLQLEYIYEMLLNSWKSNQAPLPLAELYLDTHLPEPSSVTLIIEILQLAKSLKSLEMPVHPNLKIEEVMAGLTTKNQATSFLCSPQLAALKLHFRSSNVPDEVLRALNNVAISRCELDPAQGCRLSLFSISFEDSDIAGLARKQLQRLIADDIDSTRNFEGSHWMALQDDILVYVPKQGTSPPDSLAQKYCELSERYDIGIYLTE